MRGLVIAILVLIGTAGCRPAPPTAEQVAAAAERRRVVDHQEAVGWVGAFPAQAAVLMPRLEAVSRRDVDSLDEAVATIQLFEQVGREIGLVELAATEREVDLSPKVLAAKSSLSAALIRKQQELFPAMRRTYAAYMANEVEGLQANFRAVGPRNQTLRAASPSFTSKSIVMEAHYSVVSHATRFRFKRAQYVYSFDGSYSQFEVHGRGDGDIGS